MIDVTFLGLTAAMAAGSLIGTWSLRRAWRVKKNKWRWRWSGLALLGASLLWPAWVLGEARGPFIAMTLLSVMALALVASGYTRRRAQPRRAGREGLAPEPAERATNVWRTALRWSLAGPIGMVAGMGLGVSYAVWAPGEVQTRLLIGGLIVPMAWGGAMAWTLADNRIVRATIVLMGTAIVSFGAAMLKGLT